jgi:hypothetical protein
MISEYRKLFWPLILITNCIAAYVVLHEELGPELFVLHLGSRYLIFTIAGLLNILSIIIYLRIGPVSAIDAGLAAVVLFYSTIFTLIYGYNLFWHLI